MKLHNNYQATQAVLKGLTKKKANGRWVMEEAIAEGIEMGVASPRTPSSTMMEYAEATRTKVPVYTVSPILELIEKLGNFSMLPMYKKKNGKFEHVALEVTKDVNVTEISELSYDQMNYLASVRPSAMKRFFSDYALMLADYKAVKAQHTEMRTLLYIVQRKFADELETDELNDLSEAIEKLVSQRP